MRGCVLVDVEHERRVGLAGARGASVGAEDGCALAVEEDIALGGDRHVVPRGVLKPNGVKKDAVVVRRRSEREEVRALRSRPRIAHVAHPSLDRVGGRQLDREDLEPVGRLSAREAPRRALRFAVAERARRRWGRRRRRRRRRGRRGRRRRKRAARPAMINAAEGQRERRLSVKTSRCTWEGPINGMNGAVHAPPRSHEM